MSPPLPLNKRVLIGIPTNEVVHSIIKMYQSEDEDLKNSAINFAGHIVEGYHNKSDLQRDVFGSFIDKKHGIEKMIPHMERIFPEETSILRELFGVFIFGGSWCEMYNF